MSISANIIPAVLVVNNFAAANEMKRENKNKEILMGIETHSHHFGMEVFVVSETATDRFLDPFDSRLTIKLAHYPK